MEISVKNNSETVRVEITIEYIGTFKYHFIINGDDHIFPLPNAVLTTPHRYTIGIGTDLASPYSQCDNLNIQLISDLKKDLDFRISIDWFQGENSAPIFHWPLEKEFFEGKVKVVDQVYILRLDFDYSSKKNIEYEK